MLLVQLEKDLMQECERMGKNDRHPDTDDQVGIYDLVHQLSDPNLFSCEH